MLTKHFTQFAGFEKVSVWTAAELQVEDKVWPIQSLYQGVEAF